MNEEIHYSNFIKPMNIVQIVSEKHIFKDAIILKHEGKENSGKFLALVLSPADESWPISYE